MHACIYTYIERERVVRIAAHAHSRFFWKLDAGIQAWWPEIKQSLKQIYAVSGYPCKKTVRFKEKKYAKLGLYEGH